MQSTQKDIEVARVCVRKNWARKTTGYTQQNYVLDTKHTQTFIELLDCTETQRSERDTCAIFFSVNCFIIKIKSRFTFYSVRFKSNQTKILCSFAIRKKRAGSQQLAIDSSNVSRCLRGWCVLTFVSANDLCTEGDLIVKCVTHKYRCNKMS